MHGMLNKRPDLHDEFCRAWQNFGSSPKVTGGPVDSIARAADFLGWIWVAAFTFQTADGTAVSILSKTKGEWAHEVREALRMTAWRAAAARRKDMNGIEHGIDRDATLALLNGSKLSPMQKGSLRSILAGAIWTQDRLHRAYRVESPLCPYCRQASEDHQHMWWECSAWSGIRLKHGFAPTAAASHWPSCLAVCGILPAIPVDDGLGAQEVIDLTSDEVIEPSDMEPSQGRTETWVEGRVVLYTDGASQNNQFRSLRKAGLGVFWGHKHPLNLSEPLAGPIQTNNRAELTAVLRALEIESRPVEIRTDSSYVFNGCTRYLEAWRSEGWTRKGKDICNADLWQQVSTLLERRGKEEVAFVKVKGHASQQDVMAGRVSAADKQGNDGADSLAVAGAAMPLISGMSRAELRHRMLLVQDVQRMMLEIVETRESRRQRQTLALDEVVAIDSSSSCSSRSSRGSCFSGASHISISSSSGDSGTPARTNVGAAHLGRRRRGRSAPPCTE